MISGLLRPAYYYGKRHDYVYYPESWTDQSTGTSYAAGYYDENGQYYDHVTFQKDGKYENVVCHCPYCGQDTILNLTQEDVSAHNLQCPHCGGPMEIQSELDDYVGQTVANTHTYASEESLKQFADETLKRKKAKRRRRWLIALAVLVALYLYGVHIQDSDGSTVMLVKTGQNSYAVSSSQSGDKLLVWDADSDCYYDSDTDCWLWYNTDLEPAQWQYWYEGISSDYEAGWMEHDETGWYIEASAGNWIALPDRYDTSDLWYIE